MSLAGLRCLVVGGSIGGLAAAVALLRHGAEVRVFERSPGAPDGQGAGLGLDALELVDALERRASQGGLDVRAALQDYEQRRLGPARQLVASGQAMGAAFRS